jgi:hypothetical protein
MASYSKERDAQMVGYYAPEQPRSSMRRAKA